MKQSLYVYGIQVNLYSVEKWCYDNAKNDIEHILKSAWNVLPEHRELLE